MLLLGCNFIKLSAAFHGKVADCTYVQLFYARNQIAMPTSGFPQSPVRNPRSSITSLMTEMVKGKNEQACEWKPKNKNIIRIISRREALNLLAFRSRIISHEIGDPRRAEGSSRRHWRVAPAQTHFPPDALGYLSRVSFKYLSALPQPQYQSQSQHSYAACGQVIRNTFPHYTTKGPRNASLEEKAKRMRDGQPLAGNASMAFPSNSSDITKSQSRTWQLQWLACGASDMVIYPVVSAKQRLQRNPSPLLRNVKCSLLERMINWVGILLDLYLCIFLKICFV